MRQINSRKMKFTKKTEELFIQLQYCLAIEPEPILQYNNSEMRSLMLKPDVFLKLTNDYNIEYPCLIENKILELKYLSISECIEPNDALRIIENIKNTYWVLDTVILFKEVELKLKHALKKLNPKITESEENLEIINYHNYLQNKRNNFYVDLVNNIKGNKHSNLELSTKEKEAEKNDLTLSTIEDYLHPFKVKKTLNEESYSVLVNSLLTYFKTGEFPKLEKPIKVGRTNVKSFGWNLNRIFQEEGKGVETELLVFAKANISIFKDVDFDESNIKKSNLYKYFTTKPQ